jgi:hypothetical protein
MIKRMSAFISRNPFIRERLSSAANPLYLATIVAIYLLGTVIQVTLLYRTTRWIDVNNLPNHFRACVQIAFRQQMVLLSLLTAIILPLISAGLALWEKARRRLVYIQVTPMTSPGIICGIIAKSLLPALLVYTALVPLTFLAVLSGAVSPPAAMFLFVNLIFSGVLFATLGVSVGLFFSTNYVTALLTTLIVVVGMASIDLDKVAMRGAIDGAPRGALSNYELREQTRDALHWALDDPLARMRLSPDDVNLNIYEYRAGSAETISFLERVLTAEDEAVQRSKYLQETTRREYRLRMGSAISSHRQKTMGHLKRESAADEEQISKAIRIRESIVRALRSSIQQNADLATVSYRQGVARAGKIVRWNPVWLNSSYDDLLPVPVERATDAKASYSDDQLDIVATVADQDKAAALLASSARIVPLRDKSSKSGIDAPGFVPTLPDGLDGVDGIAFSSLTGRLFLDGQIQDSVAYLGLTKPERRAISLRGAALVLCSLMVDPPAVAVIHPKFNETPVQLESKFPIGEILPKAVNWASTQETRSGDAAPLRQLIQASPKTIPEIGWLIYYYRDPSLRTEIVEMLSPNLIQLAPKLKGQLDESYRRQWTEHFSKSIQMRMLFPHWTFSTADNLWRWRTAPALDVVAIGFGWAVRLLIIAVLWYQIRSALFIQGSVYCTWPVLLLTIGIAGVIAYLAIRVLMPDFSRSSFLNLTAVPLGICLLVAHNAPFNALRIRGWRGCISSGLILAACIALLTHRKDVSKPIWGASVIAGLLLLRFLLGQVVRKTPAGLTWGLCILGLLASSAALSIDALSLWIPRIVLGLIVVAALAWASKYVWHQRRSRVALAEFAHVQKHLS